jgi:outer membrane protein assembly factor BamE (lipoprotein component of BamABCDE complex)
MLPFLLYLVLLLSFLPACGEKVLYPRIEPSIWSSYFQLQEIKPGMTKQDVIAKMGPPRVVEEGDKSGYSFFFYQTHNMDKEGSGTIRGGLTPLVFKDDRLEGMGARAYNRAMAFPSRDATTLPYVLPR